MGAGSRRLDYLIHACFVVYFALMLLELLPEVGLDAFAIPMIFGWFGVHCLLHDYSPWVPTTDPTEGMRIRALVLIGIAIFVHGLSIGGAEQREAEWVQLYWQATGDCEYAQEHQLGNETLDRICVRIEMGAPPL